MMFERDATKVREAVETVAKECGGGSIRTLAGMLGVSTQAIYKWIAHGVPVKRAIQMSIWTKGKVQWYQIVPEVLEELRHMPKGEDK
jgi:transposase